MRSLEGKIQNVITHLVHDISDFIIISKVKVKKIGTKFKKEKLLKIYILQHKYFLVLKQTLIEIWISIFLLNIIF